MSTLINIYSLRKKKSQRESRRLEIYQTVLKKCHRRIQLVAESSKDEASMFFVIPTVMVGMPTYDITSCGEYITHHLSMNGFRVLLLTPEQLFISWSHIKFNPERERALDDKIQDLKYIESGQIYPRITSRIDPPSEEKTDNQFRPLHDTPSTEKFLLS